VTVNGALANVETTANSEGTYNWIVNEAPIAGLGTATFDGMAQPAASGGGGGSSGSSSGSGGGAANNASVEMPYMIQITDHGSGRSYTSKVFTPASTSTAQGTASTTYSASYSGGYSTHTGHYDTLDSSSGGYSSDHHYFWSPFYASRSWSDSDGNNGSTNWGPALPSPLFGGNDGGIINVPGVELSVPGWLGTSGGYNAYPPTWVVHYYAKGVKHNWHWNFGGGNGQDLEVTAGGNTTMTLYTGGKSGSVKKHLFRVRASADEYGQSKIGGWAYTPTKSVPKKAIRMLGKYANQDGEVLKSLKDNEEVNLGLWCPGIKHYNAGAGIVSKECAPKRLDFRDRPCAPSWCYTSGVYACYFTLRAVCNKDWGTNYDTPPTTINWGYTVDTSGQPQPQPFTNNGAPGSCGTIIVDSFAPYTNTDVGPNPYYGNHGMILDAHYIGCCDDGELNWVQTYTEYRNGIIFTNNAADGFAAPYYYEPDSIPDPPKYHIGNHLSDYKDYENWLQGLCP
jgi:hypothetical protein